MKNRWSGIAETLGLVGVIGSLVFVGIEVRQSTIATRAATDAAIADSFRETNLVIASSPELARALTSVLDNPDGASAADRIQVLGIWRAVIHNWSNVHRQHLNGTVDPALYASVVQEISTYSQVATEGEAPPDVVRRARLLRWVWSSERFLFNPDFQQFVDSILGDPPSARR